MSIPYVVDGETDLDSALFNPWVDHMNGLQTGALPIALAGIEGALGEYGPLVNRIATIANGKDAGIVANGSTDDTSAFASFITATSSSKAVAQLPPGTIPLTSAYTIPDGTIIRGAGRGRTILSHEFNGNLFTVGHGVVFEDVTIQGNGATYSGRGLVFPDGEGAQKLNRVEVIGFDGDCLYFEDNGGSQFEAVQLTAYRTSAGTGTGRYAIAIDPTQQLSAVPHSFVQLQTGGNCAIDFGGCNDFSVIGSIIGDLAFTADSRGVNISTSRLLNQSALTVDGHGVTIVGCDIYPQITIAASADNIIIGPNAYNSLPVIDNSGNGRCQIFHHRIAYTPIMSSGGTQPSLGNGTLLGEYSRHGTVITGTIRLTLGSTTSLGTGELRFELPASRYSGLESYCGNAALIDGATTYHAIPRIAGGASYLVLDREASGLVSATSPFTFDTGDIIRISFSYSR